MSRGLSRSRNVNPGHATIAAAGVIISSDGKIIAGRRLMDADVIVVGGGLAGLVAAAEVADAGKKVILLDQEPEQSLGGPGVLVVRRLDAGELARAAPSRH
jgi:alkyl hydroperoxide reductase subunit AhpF